MKVSVIVPVYGVERFIGECAASLFGQTYQDLEYIFVDDCSPDASVAVLESVLERFPARQPYVRIIRNAVNRGSGATRSIALAAAMIAFTPVSGANPAWAAFPVIRASQPIRVGAASAALQESLDI